MFGRGIWQYMPDGRALHLKRSSEDAQVDGPKQWASPGVAIPAESLRPNARPPSLLSVSPSTDMSTNGSVSPMPKT